MRRAPRAGVVLIGAAAALAVSACADRANPTDPGAPLAARVAAPPYVTLPIGGQNVEFWPWTTSTLNVAAPDDPINIYIAGEGDPRAVRAALMALGSSTVLGCTWSDAIGDEQASAAASVGWTGSAIQIACGPFGPLPRLHLRLFDIGGALLGGAHFEVQIPGTSDHQVLSYAFAEQMVVFELLRTGLVDPTALTVTPLPPAAPPTPSTYRTIPMVVFNELPGGLQELVRGTPGDVTSDVPIPNGDGRLTVVPMAHYTGPWVGSSQGFTIDFGQAVPKPFCQAPGEWVQVVGPVQVGMTVTIGADGTLERYFRAQGQLAVTPFDGSPSYTAVVTQDQQTWATGTAHWVQAKLHQILIPAGGSGRGMRNTHLRVGTDVPADFSYVENCGPVRP